MGYIGVKIRTSGEIMQNILMLISQLFTAVGINTQVTTGDIWGLAAITLLLIAAISQILGKKESSPEQITTAKKTPAQVESKTPAEKTAATTPTTELKPAPIPKPEKTWAMRLMQGMSRSNQEIWGKMAGLLSKHGTINDEVRENIEELLYGADIGPKFVREIMDELAGNLSEKEMDENTFKQYLFDFLKGKMAPIQELAAGNSFSYNKETHNGTVVIMIVGVNGAGKTTTIGKLATRLVSEGAKVVVGACDTFRAAAVDQLEVWCERANATMIRAHEGAAPSGVGFDALKEALAQKADYCILDTAGRLHTKSNLMDELKKSKDVLAKLDPNAPHHTLLVIDAITGQNAIRQAEEFHKTLNIDGLIFTKCDGSSKAGSAIAIVDQLKVPITYIGVGEDVLDLDQFLLDDYLSALLNVDVAASI